MATLTWNDDLALGLSAMDETHEEFVQLLAQVEDATDDALLPAWQALIAHTEDHFAQEDRWMQACGFAAENCHSMQHRTALHLMRESALRCAQGDTDAVRRLTLELAGWFTHHAQNMDAALASHMQQLQFDPHTGVVHAGAALPQTPIHGCGGASCSSSAQHSIPQARTAPTAAAAA